MFKNGSVSIEAQECMGKQQTAELFKGKAVRGRTGGQSYIKNRFEFKVGLSSLIQKSSRSIKFRV